MAKISAATDEKVFRILEWYGLNENPDGDTKLKLGEAAVMRNFRITRDKNLQRRPGTAQVKGLLQSYTLEAGKEEKVRVDEGVSGQLNMYPEAAASADGFVLLSGEKVSVSYENAAGYTGYYWSYGAFTYQLVSCTYRENERTYTWNMKRVRAVSDTENKKVAGLWTGNVGGKEYLVGVCDGKLWKLHDGTGFCKEAIGDVSTDRPVFLFGYSEKLYLMNGKEYLEWDGKTMQAVEGYRPLVLVAAVPAGGGTTLEQVNKLTGARRAWYSPDGEAKEFVLPEKDLASIDYVKDMVTKEEIPSSNYTKDAAGGKVTFQTAPDKAINSIEIGWTNKNNFRAQVEKMTYAEIFNGTTDNRVFLYGDGSNQTFYSGLDYDGNPRADYFPDMNVLKIGEANTPITALIRHYSRLIVFKATSTYAVQYGLSTLVDETVSASFYATPINRSIGNAAVGQARLVLNSPRTVFGHELYEWRNNSSYSSNLSVDERQARRISDRIHATLEGFPLSECYCWDDNDGQEYYVCWGGKALVHNYAADAWYYYTGFDVCCMVNFQGKLYCGDSEGRLNSISYHHVTDNGEVIRAYWESGSEAFEREFMRKYSAMLWLGIKPEVHGEVHVTVETDKKSTYTEKVVSSSLATFEDVDFRRWSFRTNRKPHMTRSKIKAKKFVFYKMVLRTESVNTRATILTADVRVRYTGYAR